MNDDRLRRLLGAPELDALRMRLRARFERGETRDEFTLSDLSAAERRALEGLLGRAPKAASSMQLSRAELDQALQRAGLANDLRDALERLDGPIVDRRAEQLRYEQAWHALLESVRNPQMRALLGVPTGVALLKRCAARDMSKARTLIEQASIVLERLPARGVPLAHLAAERLGDSHALDAGQAVAALVLQACRGPNRDLEIPSTRDQWARLGVTVSELAAPALCLNLPSPDDSPTAALLRVGAQHGEPVYLSLRALLRDAPAFAVRDTLVFVCENPSIVAIAADRLRERCAPLVCTNGMPAAAQCSLLSQLQSAGARLRYHGDFDWPGVRIANFVIRELGASAWRMSVSDYLAGCSESGRALSPEQRVEADWDTALADAMSSQNIALHEERVVEPLMADLETGSR